MASFEPPPPREPQPPTMLDAPPSMQALPTVTVEPAPETSSPGRVLFVARHEGAGIEASRATRELEFDAGAEGCGVADLRMQIAQAFDLTPHEMGDLSLLVRGRDEDEFRVLESLSQLTERCTVELRPRVAALPGLSPYKPRASILSAPMLAGSEPDPIDAEARAQLAQLVHSPVSAMSSRQPSMYDVDLVTPLRKMRRPPRAASATDYARHFLRPLATGVEHLDDLTHLAVPDSRGGSRNRMVVVGRDSDPAIPPRVLAAAQGASSSRSNLAVPGLSPSGTQSTLPSIRGTSFSFSRTAMSAAPQWSSVAVGNNSPPRGHRGSRPSVRTLAKAESAPNPLNEVDVGNRLFDFAISEVQGIEVPLDILWGLASTLRILGVRSGLPWSVFCLGYLCHTPIVTVVQMAGDVDSAAVGIRFLAGIVSIATWCWLRYFFSMELPDEILRSMAVRSSVVLRVRRWWRVVFVALWTLVIGVGIFRCVDAYLWHDCEGASRTKDDVCIYGSEVAAVAVLFFSPLQWGTPLMCTLVVVFFVTGTGRVVRWYQHVLRLDALPNQLIKADFERTAGLVIATSRATTPVGCLVIVGGTLSLALAFFDVFARDGNLVEVSRGATAGVTVWVAGVTQFVFLMAMIAYLASCVYLSQACKSALSAINDLKWEHGIEQLVFLTHAKETAFEYMLLGSMPIDARSMVYILYLLVSGLALAGFESAS